MTMEIPGIENLNILWLIPFFPALGSVLSYLAGFRNKNYSGWIATAASFSSFILVLSVVLRLSPGTVFEQPFFGWLYAGDLKVDFLLRFDQLTAVMCLVVAGVGSLIHLYSISYMAEDPSRPRFFAYLNLFMFAMLTLVLGGNLPVLFVGWEGVGLCSYLLIGFWHKNPAFAAAGRKAFVVNRIGDAGFLAGMFILFSEFGSLNFASLKDLVLAQPDAVSLYALIGLCLFVGACGKSAQIPLFVWHPDAMAGPTPVSALIHAATMVTAGVYMMARMSFLYAAAGPALAVVAVVSVLTAFMAATIAMTQNDIKKVLAYSTVSQLGFMFMACAAQVYWAAIFHLITHAFFKACLFLGAGSVIHGCHHEQDMRHMGGLLKKMPVTSITYGVAVLAIAGVAPLSGYYSKHAILAAFGDIGANPALGEGLGQVVVFFASLTAFITAFYMTRSFAMTFLGKYRGHAEVHESPFNMTFVLAVLALLSIVAGHFLIGHFSLPEYLSPVLGHSGHHAGESFFEAILHSWVGLAGIALGLLLYVRYPAVPGKAFNALKPLSTFVERKYCWDEMYQSWVIGPLEYTATALWKVIDQPVIDGAVNGSAKLINGISGAIKYIQTGQIRDYAVMMFLAVSSMLVFYVLY